jgi:outer membrane protein OmpA-like peptidoglycan-associated protein
MRPPRLDADQDAAATVRDADRTIPDGPAPTRGRGLVLSLAAAGLLLLVPLALPLVGSARAEARLEAAEAAPPDPSTQRAVAAEADESYCNGSLKQVLRRVLTSCGLLGGSGGRGCQPADARQVATMAGGDFNTLFLPMKERGAILQFERAEAGLDPSGQQLAAQVFADRRGASYFLVVARASPDGPEQVNRELSRSRAEGVLAHLQQTFTPDELEGRVGLLWLGEEFAQLDASFCEWSRSGTDACSPEDLNRSAFVAWIDCTL